MREHFDRKLCELRKEHGTEEGGSLFSSDIKIVPPIDHSHDPAEAKGNLVIILFATCLWLAFTWHEIKPHASTCPICVSYNSPSDPNGQSNSPLNDFA